MNRVNTKPLFLSIIFSLVINGLFLQLNHTVKDFSFKTIKSDEGHTMVIKIRELGRNGKDKNDVIALSDLGFIGSGLSARKRSIGPIKNLSNKKTNHVFKTQSQESIKTLGLDGHNAILHTGSKIEVKKGLNVDELNKHELVYYSFKQRGSQKYLSSISKNFLKLKELPRPLLKKLEGTRHLMTGKIEYDREGNVVNIKVLKWSESDSLQSMFLQSLKDIRSIPNPPKGILDEKGFIVKYDLTLTL